MEAITPYLLLGIATVFGVIQSTFQKAGIGNDEQLGEGGAAFAYIIFSIPLMLLSNLGLIAIIVWAPFVLDPLPAILVSVVGIAGWGYLWGLTLGHIRRTPTWDILHKMGIPLILAARSITAGCVIYLAICFTRSGNL